jgi:hypothetical protein
MQRQAIPRSNRVRAVFQDTTMRAFDLDREATFGELAEKIGKLANFHGGLFLPVQVQLGKAAHQSSSGSVDEVGPSWAPGPRPRGPMPLPAIAGPLMRRRCATRREYCTQRPRLSLAGLGFWTNL